jgi:Zn-dependent protease
LIAWGGAAAQLIVAAPLIVFAKAVGSTGVASLDVAIVVLAVYSPIMALVNLIPISTLDGRKAWPIVPLAWKKFRRRRNLVALTPMEAMEEALRKARDVKRQ